MSRNKPDIRARSDYFPDRLVTSKGTLSAKHLVFLEYYRLVAGALTYLHSDSHVWFHDFFMPLKLGLILLQLDGELPIPQQVSQEAHRLNRTELPPQAPTWTGAE